MDKNVDTCDPLKEVVARSFIKGIKTQFEIELIIFLHNHHNASFNASFAKISKCSSGQQWLQPPPAAAAGSEWATIAWRLTSWPNYNEFKQ